MYQLTDFSDPALTLFARLNETELLRLDEPRAGLFVAETLTVIERALSAGFTPVSLLLEKRLAAGQGAPLLQRFFKDYPDVPVHTADEALLSGITGYPLTRGALCAFRRKELPPAESLLTNARRVAVLCDVMNPTNLGAIVRSAAAFGVDAVLLTRGCTDPLYRRAIRVSVGTVFQVPWTFLGKNPAAGAAAHAVPVSGAADAAAPADSVSAAAGAVRFLQSRGFFCAAMALTDNSVSVDDPALHSAEKCALFLGSEGPGLPEDAVRACDLTVKLPMANGVDSLNVAAAAAVAFWELTRGSRAAAREEI